MAPDPQIPPFDNDQQAGSVPPLLPASEPPGASGVPPLLTPDRPRKSSTVRQLILILLSLYLGLFMADAVVSLVDDSLILFLDIHAFTALREVLFFFVTIMALGTYGLMALTPMIPKRVFLPVTLFNPVAVLVSLPVLIYSYSRIQQVAWVISFGQVVFCLSILYCFQGGFKFRWPLVAESQLAARRFSWPNLLVFLLLNVCVLLPIAVVYLFLCAALAVDHFSEGFAALRPGGLTVRVREYVRNDGKTIQLVPMSHIGESDFYRTLSQSFPTNAVILMEGVTDTRHLLTNRISYKRMALSLGVTEQVEEFKPSPQQLVRADVDVEQFASSTIDFLNRVMLVYSRGLNAGNVRELVQYSPPPDFEQNLMEDLLRKRNRRLLEEIQAQLPQSENIIVPWGVAHMPEIAREIQRSGFRLEKTREHVAIRFRSGGNKGKGARK
jgi:hypothetical protein